MRDPSLEQFVKDRKIESKNCPECGRFMKPAMKHGVSFVYYCRFCEIIVEGDQEE
jgi:ribosomal protein L37AE/L43A